MIEICGTASHDIFLDRNCNHLGSVPFIMYIILMATRTEIKVSVQSRDNRELPSTESKIIKVEWDKPERTRNALRTFGLLITFTFASVFIPILHFVLVPTLFITSFVLAMDKMGEKMRSEGGKGECPKCHKEFNVQPSKWGVKITNNCDHCHEDLEMVLIQ